MTETRRPLARWDTGDIGLSLLLTEPRHWCAILERDQKIADLVPTKCGRYWHAQVADGKAEERVFSKHPMSPEMVGFWLEDLFPLAADWKACDQFEPSEVNPFTGEPK